MSYYNILIIDLKQIEFGKYISYIIDIITYYKPIPQAAIA